MKKIWLLIVVFLFILVGVALYFVFKDNDGGVFKNSFYEVHTKVNPLVTFKFKASGDKYVVVDYILVDDKAKEIFSEIDFKEMDLLLAIELYGDKVKEAGIVFNTIYLFTDLANVDYFKSEKYNLKTEVMDDDFSDILDETKASLKYDTKYYSIDDQYGYSITFKENGVLEYHIDKSYAEKICDEYNEDNCYDFVYDDKYYGNIAKEHQYRLDGNYVIIEARDGGFYNGWYYSYDKCEIMFNKIKCDNYNAFHGAVAEYQYTNYYEVMD